jgi:thioredoxin 1
MGTVQEIKTPEEYIQKISNGLVVVDYYTEWCGPCRNFAPKYRELAERYPDVVFLKVDSETIEHPDCETISKVPTFRVFLRGELKQEFSGVDPERLERYIQRYQIRILWAGQTARTVTKSQRQQIIEYLDSILEK